MPEDTIQSFNDATVGATGKKNGLFNKHASVLSGVQSVMGFVVQFRSQLSFHS